MDVKPFDSYGGYFVFAEGVRQILEAVVCRAHRYYPVPLQGKARLLGER